MNRASENCGNTECSKLSNIGISRKTRKMLENTMEEIPARNYSDLVKNTLKKFIKLKYNKLKYSYI